MTCETLDPEMNSGAMVRGPNQELADYHLRSNGQWSARGKGIPRALQLVNPGLRTTFCESFDKLFRDGDVDAVIHLTEALLKPHGGLLFDGISASTLHQVGA